MIRCQFYATNDLIDKIHTDAKKKGISQSAEIVEKLELAYRIIDNKSENTTIFSNIMIIIQNEVKNYVDTLIKKEQFNEEFTLYKASKTFANISMADDNKRLVSMKPRIGKAFRALVDNKAIPYVNPCFRENGKQKREHNAALYKLTM